MGPVTSGVAVTPSPTVQGEPATLTATVDDSATGGTPIASAEYNIDGGAWILMTASDGLYDSPTEAVEVELVMATAGTYAACVRGTDAEANTGAPSCTIFTVNAQAVNGGGHIYSTPKRKAWTFGSGIVMDLDGDGSGHFTLAQHTGSKWTCNFDEISNLVVSGDTATFDATGACNDGVSRTVSITMTDNGEPGAGVDELMVTGDVTIDNGAGGPRLINGGNFQVADAAALFDRSYTLFADGSISCPGADDLSDPDGFVLLSPIAGGVMYEYNFLGAEPSRSYTIAVSQEPSCSAASFPGSALTDATGDGTFSGFYAVVPGTYNLLMNSVTSAAGLSDPRHREISTVDGWVIVS